MTYKIVATISTINAIDTLFIQNQKVLTHFRINTIETLMNYNIFKT